VIARPSYAGGCIAQRKNAPLTAISPTRKSKTSRRTRWYSENIPLLFAHTEFSRREFFIKVSTSEFRERVVSILNAVKKSMFAENTTSLTSVIPMSVNISSYNCRRDLSSVSDILQDGIINGNHPVSALAHEITSEYQWLRTPRSKSKTVQIQIYRFAYAKDISSVDISGSITEATRGLVTPRWVHCRKQAGRCLGHRVRDSFREIGTEAMFDNNARGLESPERDGESEFNCPFCGRAVAGVDAHGPDAHTFDPCGCSTGEVTASDLADEPRVMADGGVSFADFHAFERDLLYAIRTLERDGELPKGLDIKAFLERDYAEEINHSRLYQNLDGLVERGLVAKGQKDDRTNEYATTEEGRRLVDRDAERRAEQVGLAVAGGETA